MKKIEKNGAVLRGRRGMAFVAFLVMALTCGQAMAAEATMPVRAKIIGFEDVKIMCGSEAPPSWCPAHLLRKDAVDTTTERAQEQMSILADAANHTHDTQDLTVNMQ
jgi:hypothetical protein